MSPAPLALLTDVPAQGGGALTLDVDGTPVGIYRVGEDVVAWRNVCPHGAAPVCRGVVDGTRLPSEVYTYVYGRDQEILQCPWHGWEFDLRTGQHLAEGSGARLRRFPIEVRDGGLYDGSASPQRTSIDTVVVDRDEPATAVVRFRVERVGAESFPAWAPGTHIEVQTPSGLRRQYSLCGDPRDRSALEFAVLREDSGRGGSVEMHDAVDVGTRLRITAIRNRFPLLPRPRYLVLAAGIGITPLVPMIAALRRRRASFDLVYVGSSRDRMPFLDTVEAHPGAQVIESRTTGRPALADLLDETPDGTTVYACGPAPMLVELRALMPAHEGRLELIVESFGAAGAVSTATGADDRPVTVELAGRGAEVTAPPGTSILDALRRHGVSMPSSCEQGWCGSCETAVLDGDVDHRDTVLSDAERDAGDSMMICVSRAHSDRLVLDL